MSGYTFTPPDDWRVPDWNYKNYVHEWKRYIAEPVRRLWPTLTDEQKQALAYQADEEAGREEWD